MPNLVYRYGRDAERIRARDARPPRLASAGAQWAVVLEQHGSIAPVEEGYDEHCTGVHAARFG